LDYNTFTGLASNSVIFFIFRVTDYSAEMRLRILGLEILYIIIRAKILTPIAIAAIKIRLTAKEIFINKKVLKICRYYLS
jgi:hypothetical protein